MFLSEIISNNISIVSENNFLSFGYAFKKIQSQQ